MPGTYIALRVHPASENTIRKFMQENGLDSHYSDIEHRRHCTVIYAPNDDFTDEFQKHVRPLETYLVDPIGFDIFPFKKDTGKCLVLKVKSPKLVDRHETIVRLFDCKNSYPNYVPHITFTYDFGDRSLDSISSFTSPLLLSEEYCEPIKEGI